MLWWTATKDSPQASSSSWRSSRLRDHVVIASRVKGPFLEFGHTCSWRLGLNIMVEISVLKRPASEAVITQRKFFKKTARGKVIKGTLKLLNPLYQDFWSFFVQFFANDIFGMMYHVVFKAAGNVNQRLQVRFLWLGSWDIPRFWTVILFCLTQMFSCPK